MYRAAPASVGAKRLLSSAARSLRTADPVAVLGGVIDESLYLPPGSDAYRRPHAFETKFSERAPRTLAFDLTPADPYAEPTQRVEGATRAARQLVLGNFGAKALHWLDGRSEPLQYGSDEAWLSSSFDGRGVQEAQVTYAWGPQTTDSLSGPIHETVRQAIEAVPSLRLALTSVRCGRSFGSQEITFAIDGPLRLADLRPLMDRFGLGGQHTRLVNALAFVLGARFLLPPETALVTLRPTPAGMELRIDVDLEGIPDVPPNVASLLQLQLVERPAGLNALESWIAAMTPVGVVSPGALSVLSVVVRPETGPRVALQMRPSAVIDSAPAEPPPATSGANVPVAAAASVAARSPWLPQR